MDKDKIFPSFRRQNRWLGIIDYKSLIVFGSYIYIIYLICMFIGLSAKIMFFIIIVFSTPLISIYFVNVKEESIVDVIFVVLRFYLSKKEYYYKIENKREFDIPIKRRKNKVTVSRILEALKI